jgi:hypothetical protein
MSDVFFEILTPLPLSRRQDAHDLFTLWGHIAPGFFPDRYGGYEPLRQEFSIAQLDEALKWWEHQFLLKRVASPKLESSIFMQYGPHRTHSSWKISLKKVREFDQRVFCNLLENSAGAYMADFGFIHKITESEIERGRENQSIAFLNSAHTQKTLFVTTHMLRKSIPDVYWMTIFGAPYVQLFSRDRLLSVPAYRVQELDNGSVLVQLTENLVDAAADEVAFEDIRSRVKYHLNSDAFYDPKKGMNHQYQVPEFTWHPILQ